MTRDPQDLLPEVIAAAATAGAMIAAEFCRPQGPRQIDQVTAPIDREVELVLRERLLGLLPARFVGEEAGVVDGAANGLCWVVDPHDGTRAFLEGRRGSAVSIALQRQGRPLLAVVFAPLSPDRGPDMIAWAAGGPITRNGTPVASDLTTRGLGPHDVVFLNHGVWQRPVWNGRACAPARFMPLPSIAYRLARIAAGDGVATQTLRPVNALDIAAGHALLEAAGGVLLAEDGTPVTYNERGESRPSACFGGAPRAVATLLTRTWRGSTEPRREPRLQLSWPRAPEGTALDRALGCLFGLAIGDALGAQVEFQSADAIARSHPVGVRHMADSPVWRTIAGQVTDDTELALALARTLAGRGRFDAEAVATAYAAWYASDPFDVGRTTARAFAAAAHAPSGKAAAARAAADRTSQSNGALMRCAPIGLWAGDPQMAAAAAREDAALSHPHPVCQAASAAFTAAIALALQGADPAAMIDAMGETARGIEGAEPLLTTIAQARAGAPIDFATHPGWVLVAFGNAVRHLHEGTDAEQALSRTIAMGGDTDTNAAVAGALLGAARGRRAFPVPWTMPVLTCRPDPGLAVPRPRPDIYWADDLSDLAEALLISRNPA